MRKNEFKSYVPGFAAGFFRTVVAYPFDSLKIRMQKNQSGTMWTNVVDIFKRDPKIFYRGSGINFFSIPIDRAIQYSILEKYKDKYNNFAVGYLAGSISSLYMTPIQYITRNAVLSSKKEYGNIYEFIKSDKFNIKKMYTGFPIEYLKVSVGASLSMGVYVSLREMISKEHQVKLSPVLGGVASMAAWTAIFPFDSIMTEYVSNKRNNIDRSLNSIIKYRYQTRGMHGFYFGIIPVYIRSIPSAAAGMFAYEYVRHALK